MNVYDGRKLIMIKDSNGNQVVMRAGNRCSGKIAFRTILAKYKFLRDTKKEVNNGSQT